MAALQIEPAGELIAICPRATMVNRRMLRITAVLLVLIIMDMCILPGKWWGVASLDAGADDYVPLIPNGQTTPP
jgi:hypothetical protein